MTEQFNVFELVPNNHYYNTITEHIYYKTAQNKLLKLSPFGNWVEAKITYNICRKPTFVDYSYTVDWYSVLDNAKVLYEDQKAHFAGIKDGRPQIYPHGSTSWSNKSSDDTIAVTTSSLILMEDQ